MSKTDAILEIKNLRKHFVVKTKGFFSREKQVLKAVDGVSLSVQKGEVLGLVGESGCGKTTLARTVVQLYVPTSGEIIFRRFPNNTHPGGEIHLHEVRGKALKKLRRDIQVVFQDPLSSLNPRWDVKSIIAEPIIVQGLQKELDVVDRVASLLRSVGLSPDHMKRYPHEFSGGQRQRIGIARALALKPQVVIADEPVSALDVSIQAQILNLLQDLQEEFNLTYIFIAHDLLVVEYMSDRIAVMYLGRIVELSGSSELFIRPLHPYTEALLSAVPIPNPRYKANRILLQGDVPSPINAPPGCHFHPRCAYSKAGLCDKEIPLLREIEKQHFVACHRVGEIKMRGIEKLLNSI